MSNVLQSPHTPSRDVLSVTSLNRMAKSLLEGHFPNVLVEGEISNLAMPASGHWYFTLKDEGSQVRCAMFRNRNMGAGFRPRDGMQVLVRGRLSLYEGRGDYQLIAESVEEAGDGALRRRFEMLKQKLAAEGLFASERKRSLPEQGWTC
jgi:exodeoxyribonuclease VII large subunit